MPPSIGRSTRIRTLDPLVPNQMRYQAALHSDVLFTLDALCQSGRPRTDIFRAPKAVDVHLSPRSDITHIATITRQKGCNGDFFRITIASGREILEPVSWIRTNAQRLHTACSTTELLPMFWTRGWNRTTKLPVQSGALIPINYSSILDSSMVTIHVLSV